MNLPPPEALEQLGRSMREIDPSTLASDPDEGPVRWFLGESGTELFAWGGSETTPATHLQLVFARVQLEWTQRAGLTAAPFRAQGSTMGGRYDQYLLGADRSLDRRLLEASLQVLRSSVVPPSLMQPLLTALEQALARTLD